MPTPSSVPPPTPLLFQPGVPAKHYLARLEEIRALPESQLLPMTLDVFGATEIVLGAVPELRRLASELCAKLVDFDAASIEQLESIALATAYAHTARIADRRQSEPLPAVAERGAAVRAALHVAAIELAQAYLLSSRALGGYRGGVGYLALASDLGLLVKVFRDAWPAIEGKTAVTAEEIDEAEILAAQLVIGFGVREPVPGEPLVSTTDWQRAFTLLVTAYDEMRRAVTYVRWHERDARVITPSLYPGSEEPGAEP